MKFLILLRMKIKNSIFLFLLSTVILICNCTPTQNEILETYCRNKEFDIDFNNRIIVILIPIEGCSVCVSKSVDFIKAHPEYPFHYVLSSVFKRNIDYISKQLQSTPDKLFYDFENTLMMQGLVNQIPKAFLIDKNRIIFSIQLGTKENYNEFINAVNENFELKLVW